MFARRIAVGQRLAYPKQLFANRGYFQNATRSVARPSLRPGPDRGPPTVCARDRTQPTRIVGIRVPASDRHDALRDQLSQLMLNLFRLTLVFESSGQRGRKFQNAYPQRATESLRRRYFLVVDQISRPRDAKRFPRTEHTVLSYAGSNESLLLVSKTV